ncbi:MarR family winged helix-turn-helix transcriptional regulator [Novosphingobium sp. KA1]|uniref:MarR family winged helix-turn-helix transcriptional regulator n=1 Tax=Novosphingobium sp. (strain KA1) TaxID=164608 RepID=UPI001A8F3278|nr:MarR family winged helix-turn-helix transcriptional regulator [Novosphingobium sp. KA1]QSR18826.1 MarR family transcriptional regulator [Novosphingobium sp. KA1]
MATEAEDKLTGKLGDVLNDKTESPRRQVSLRLTVIARLQRNNFDRLVTELNVTRSQWAMIAVVARYPGSTQRTVAEYLEMSEASAGRLIDRLCADGLLERRDRRDDRRARSVYVTDAAHPLLEKLGLIAAEAEGRMFAGFSDAEVEQMRDYLNRIYDNVSRG